MLPSALQLLARIKYFASVFGLFSIIAGILLFTLGYEGSFNLLNQPFHPQGDYFFPFITFLGDASILLAIYMLFYWRKEPVQVVLLGLSIVITGIIVQIMKHYIFPDMARPIERLGEAFLTGRYYEYPGIPIERFHSFPSGHSVTIVACMTLWAFRTSSAFWQLSLAILALLVLHSRIYIGVHFLGDVFASALIGFAVSFRLYLFYENTKDNLPILERLNKIISHPLARQAGIGVAIGILLVNFYVKIFKVFLS